MKIGTTDINIKFNPYIIAEIGVNHGGDLDIAKKMVKLAHDGGANAVKFQVYKASELAIKDSPIYWDQTKEKTTTQHELFSKYDSFGIDEYREIAKLCTGLKIDFICTPFDNKSVDMMSPLVTAFKVASADITNLPLLFKIASKNKPTILSTGGAGIREIRHAYIVLDDGGVNNIALLHCVLKYPTPDNQAQLGFIQELISKFPLIPIGYSDHVAVALKDNLIQLEIATLLGATILEKHFTYDKSLEGNDHYHAMDADDLKKLKIRLAMYRVFIGNGSKDIDIESDAIKFARRSIVCSKDIKKGDTFTVCNLTTKRPGTGISPVYWDCVLGKKATKDMKKDEIFNWSCSTEKP